MLETESLLPDQTAPSTPQLPLTMLAAFCPRYGSPDVIEIRQIALPVLEEDHVLLRVRAASLNLSLSGLKRVLAPASRVVAAGAPRGASVWRLVFHILKLLLAARFGKQNFAMLSARLNPADALVLSELVESGKLKPAIERTYELAEIREAFRYLSTGRVGGKLVIKL